MGSGTRPSKLGQLPDPKSRCLRPPYAAAVGRNRSRCLRPSNAAAIGAESVPLLTSVECCRHWGGIGPAAYVRRMLPPLGGIGHAAYVRRMLPPLGGISHAAYVRRILPPLGGISHAACCRRWREIRRGRPGRTQSGRGDCGCVGAP